MEELQELIMRAQKGDKEAREQLVEENMGLVYHVAKRFYGRGTEPEDLAQLGAIGLMKAIDRFDLKYEVKFSTYAVPMIAGEIRRFLRDDSMIKVSRSLKELAGRAGPAKEKFCMQNGREPGILELAEILRVEPEELAAALDSAAEVQSLQRGLGADAGDSLCLMDLMAAEAAEDPQEEALRRVLLEHVLSELEPKERMLIVMRFFHEQTQARVAKQLGMSQVQVSRMEKKTLGKMRELLTKP